MKKQPENITYDFETDILTARRVGQKYDGSISAKNLVLDLNEEGQLIGFELFSASKSLGRTKEFLKKVRWRRARVDLKKDAPIKIHLLGQHPNEPARPLELEAPIKKQLATPLQMKVVASC